MTLFDLILLPRLKSAFKTAGASDTAGAFGTGEREVVICAFF